MANLYRLPSMLEMLVHGSPPPAGGSWARVVVRTAAGLALAPVLLGAADGGGACALALKPAPRYVSTPEMAEMVYDDVTFGTADDILLHGWFFPFQDQEGEAFREPKPIIVMPTDGTDNMGSLLWHYFTFFRGTPWHVLMFDWRGMGTSARWDIDTTRAVIPELLVDLAAAIDYSKQRPEYDGQHLGIFAFGPSAAVALAAAATRDDLGAVAVRGVYTTQAELCARWRAAKPPVACVPHPRWPAELEPIRAAPRVKVPVLVVVGDDDEITPPDMARAVHEALGGPKQYWAAPRAGHAGYDSPEYVHRRPFAVKLHGFFGRYLGRE